MDGKYDMTKLHAMLRANLVTDGCNPKKVCVRLDDLKPHAERVHEISGSGRMWLLAASEGIHWDFILLDFASSACDDADMVCDVVFTASGPRGSLRELRHMDFSPIEGTGYLFYPDLLGIAKALNIVHEIMEEEKTA